MKTIFVEAKYDKELIIPKIVLNKLPSKIMLFLTAQLINQKKQLIKQLNNAGKIVVLKKTPHTIYEGQLIGCNTEVIKGDFEAFFYIGDGMFHPEALIVKNDKPVHIWNMISKDYKLLTLKDAQKLRKRIQSAKMKFLISKEIGVLVTTKPGQNKLEQFMKLKKDYPEKNFYLLANNNIEFDSLEDFPFIECYVNTVCARIAYDDYDKFPKIVLNVEDLA
ncbi:MAG: diphthamide synthesis protein [Nanoarchaeota archaeon]|nr:diphthamide synthesis protein [Nanoarchaeota archaeon]